MTNYDASEATFAPLTPDELIVGKSGREDHASDLTFVSPAPLEAPAAMFRHPQFGTPTAKWTYKDSVGALLGYVCRFDVPGQRKQFSPLTLWRGEKGLVWKWKHWSGIRPLYGLDRLAARPQAEVLVVEGEKCVDLAQDALPELVVVSSSGGALSAEKADWSALRARSVRIWPDADAAGQQYQKKVAELLVAVGAYDVELIDPTALASRLIGCASVALTDGWDVADALEQTSRPQDLWPAILAAGRPHIPRPTYRSFHPFTMDETGLSAVVTSGKAGQGESSPRRVSDPFEVIGRARDPNGCGWAKVVRWRDPDGRIQTTLVTDMSIHGDPGALASELANRGLNVSRAMRSSLADYLNEVDARDRVTIVSRTGWHDIGGSKVFVLPD